MLGLFKAKREAKKYRQALEDILAFETANPNGTTIKIMRRARQAIDY